MSLESALEYLSQYSGLSLFFRAEFICSSNSQWKVKVLEYCLKKEEKSKIVFKIDEAKRSLNKMVEGWICIIVESEYSEVRAEFEEKIGKAKQAAANATRVSDKGLIISTLLVLAEIYLEYGDVLSSLVSLRKVRSYVSISNTPGILALLKKAQFFGFAEDELLIVPTVFLQSFEGRVYLRTRI